jgi:hypothetical protein
MKKWQNYQTPKVPMPNEIVAEGQFGKCKMANERVPKDTGGKNNKRVKVSKFKCDKLSRWQIKLWQKYQMGHVQGQEKVPLSKWKGLT